MLLTGAFVAWSVNWIVAEVVTTIDHETGGKFTKDEFVIQVTLPTPTPWPATPVVGTPGCVIGMVCKTPTEPPIDCAEVSMGNQNCTYTGYTGDAKKGPDVMPIGESN